MTTAPLHLLTVEDGVAVVTRNRPEALISVNQAMETPLSAGLRFDIEAWVGCMHSDEWKEKLAGFVRKERKS